MFVGDKTPRPVPHKRHVVSLDELINLRYWPPARGHSRERMAIREGHHLSHIRGRGMEFDDVREYQPGDDIRHLDWRLMARTGEAHTKLYREERERPVFVLVDLRSPMYFATQGHFKSVLACYAATMVMWTTLANGDRIGGQLLGTEQSTIFKPSNNRQQVMRMVSALAEASSLRPTSHSLASLSSALAQAESYLPSGTLVYLFSDFHDVDEAAQQHLMRLAQRCELKLVLISDPLEQRLPEGKPYRFLGEGQEITVNPNAKQQARYVNQFEERVQRLDYVHHLRGVEFAHWQTHQHPLFSSPTAKEGR
ncbi:DUF58 domain-containing protein [Neptunomonas phycophila]|uniref:DUF58 domain-containing protein n=1 Tax=Neptunomonas phycophila TaxID=1572645 RepID=UPI000948EC1E|nr:DUF58 domain-containing protein [Neptunomonas phycophila]